MKVAAVMILTTTIFAASGHADTLLVANKSDDTLDVIDLVSGKSRARLETGHAPHEIAVSPDGRTAVVTNYGDRATPGSSLTVVDLRASKVVRTIDLGEHRRPHGVAWLDANRIAVTAEGSGRLLVVDVRAGTVAAAFETGAEISHMVAVAGSRAFVANIGSGSVTAIDLDGKKARVAIATGAGAEGIAVRPRSNEVWVTNREADTLSVIDAKTLEVKATVEAKGFPIRIAFTPDGRRAIVSAARSGEVVLVDAEERREIRRAALDLRNAPDAAQRLFGDRFGASPVPVGIVMAADGKTAFVAATQSDAVVVIDTSTLEVRDLLKAGREPDGMALAP